MSCDVGHRHDSDMELLWLSLWLEAVALIRSLAWEPPFAVGATLKKAKKKRRRRILSEELVYLEYGL